MNWDENTLFQDDISKRYEKKYFISKEYVESSENQKLYSLIQEAIDHLSPEPNIEYTLYSECDGKVIDEGKVINQLFVEKVKDVDEKLQSIKTPEELSMWMIKNIKYYQHDKENIYSYNEVIKTGRGDCYDQVEFEKVMFHKMKIKYKCLFIIEYNHENWQQGYGTHSLLYYEKNGKFYWFENAWQKEKGIHGPYRSVKELKDELAKKWNYENGSDRLYITSLVDVKPGISHGEYAIKQTENMTKEPKDAYKKESVNEDWSFILESEEEIEWEEFLEAVSNTILKDSIGPYIDNTFNDHPENVRKFNNIVSQYINRNISKLTTSGPVYLIPFTDADKQNYFDLFGIDAAEIKRAMKEHTKTLNDSKFLLLSQNPIFALFYFVIRYFTVHPDKKSLNSAISIYALANYPSIYTKYFPNGVIEPVMQYTIDNLTDKFLIKKSKHIFGVLVESAQRSYNFLKPYMKEGQDKEVIRFIQRIRNDQNSLIKKITNIYMENHKKGNAVVITNGNYDDNTPIVDEVNNATIEVQNAVSKVSLPIIMNGVDILRAEACAKMSQIGVADARLFLIDIMVEKNLDSLQKLIESILFLYLYESKKTIRDIRSQYFLSWAAALFKKTNSKNENIRRINDILNEWAQEVGIYAKYKREASRINYKKSIFFYIILSIQKYI